MSAHDRGAVQETLRQLDSMQGAKSNDVNRRFKRFPARGEAWFARGRINVGPITPTMVHVRDISRGGMGVLSNVALKHGESVQMRIGAQGLVAAVRPAFCRHCRELSPEMYLIGFEFGIEAAVMMALGVPGNEISHGDEPEATEMADGEFLAPEI